jgi:hypothetical protein
VGSHTGVSAFPEIPITHAHPGQQVDTIDLAHLTTDQSIGQANKGGSIVI